MADKKLVIRFFTIADYEEEEIWLHHQHLHGWKLAGMIPPCFYTFERCEPAEVAYRLDYKNHSETSDYFQIFRDYGWEYVDRCVGWLYFRKPSTKLDAERDGEIFSDNESRVDLIDHVIKTRLRPLAILFLCLVLPNLIRCLETRDPQQTVFAVLFGIIAVLYIYLLVYCGVKLRRLREKYKNE
ncbi:MAG: DUF2812 domain-containing protein [Gemmiger sp.]